MIDIYDMLWAPRLVVREGASIIKNSIIKKDHTTVNLVMDDHDECHLYPRPRLRRDSYFSLNGEWAFCSRCSYEDDDLSSIVFNEIINVPYPVEAPLSGVNADECAGEFAYMTVFSLPDDFVKDRVILHFGAVDQECKVFINGVKAAVHEGGYLPFECDITDNIDIDGVNELIVKVRDTLNRKYPYGKQTEKPGGMWYTKVSGIWQTVWIESLPKHHVKKVTCSVKAGSIHDGKAAVNIDIEGSSLDYRLTVFSPSIEDDRYPDDDILTVKNVKPKILMECKLKKGDNLLKIENASLWTPDNPYMYRFLLDTDEDRVESYFTLCAVSIDEIKGTKRICLNHKALFFHGILDQGYFPDGIFTPGSDRYYEDDIRNMKELGFNVLRKHLKVEPERFYYDCDRLGMMVFQDMVNNGEYDFVRQTAMPTFTGQWKDDRNKNVPDDVKESFIDNSIGTIRHLKGFGCIVYYTVFNEGWGQFDSVRVTDILRHVDPDKIYDTASGWFKQDEMEVDSDHFYYHKIKHHKWKRPVIISECGGYTMKVDGHSYYPNMSYGYGNCKTKEALTMRIFRLYDYEVIPHFKHGVCGCIYTQLSDVESEYNGLYTYDRKVCKVDRRKMEELKFKLDKAYEFITEDADK